MKQRTNLSILRDVLDMQFYRTDLAIYLGLKTPLLGTCWWREGEGKRKGVEEAYRLKVLHDYKDGLHETINKRAALFDMIQRNARNGMIGIVESGRDCDCVDYVHPRQSIPATLYAYLKLYNETAQWADGPFSFSILPPDEAQEVEPESHDRVLEAFENGHPHHVISTFHG